MDWYFTAFELIDLRSFSNLWFWIMLAVFWSTTSHYVLGVPFDLVSRAQSDDLQAKQDLDDMVRIQTNRLLFIADTSGTWLVGFIFFFLSGLIILGFIYYVEFAQALFLLGAPMSIILTLSIHSARKIRLEEGDAVIRRLRKHRLIAQVIGMLSIFVTSMWGMYINVTVGVL